MNAKSPVTVRVTHRFDASPERVFDAWLDPEKARGFLFVTASGELVCARIDARVGGAFAFVGRRDGEDIEHTGEYLEIERPRRLVFSLTVQKHARDTDRVTVEIVPLRTGCELTLTHEMGREWADHTDSMESGWIGILAALAAMLNE